MFSAILSVGLDRCSRLVAQQRAQQPCHAGWPTLRRPPPRSASLGDLAGRGRAGTWAALSLPLCPIQLKVENVRSNT